MKGPHEKPQQQQDISIPNQERSSASNQQESGKDDNRPVLNNYSKVKSRFDAGIFLCNKKMKIKDSKIDLFIQKR
jgi:hypothetical protein